MRTLRRTPTRPSRSTRLAVGGITVAALALALTACGSEPSAPVASAADQADALVVEDPWVRATVDTEDSSMTAAFMTLDNESDAPIHVVGASAEVAGMTQIHEMASVDGKVVMREAADGIEMAAHRGQVLQPGGLHVMLMDVSQPLAPGDEVTFTLELADGSSVTVTAPVKEFTEEEGHYHEPGTPTEHSHQ